MAASELYRSVNIGGVELSNRVVLSPMLLSIATDGGEVTREVIDFYGARAKGGAGLIITGGAYVAEGGGLFGRAHKISQDKQVAGWRSVVEVVHGYGARIAVQLMHGGIRARSAVTGEQPVGPSSVSLPDLAETPRELTSGEIQNLVSAFGEAARRAREAGFDGIELHCSAAFLIQQFLSPHTNLRADEYGGSWENRLRFPLEVVRAVRENVGSDLFLGCRVPHDEIVADGLTLEDTRNITEELVKAGLDFVRVVVGVSPPRGREDSQRTSTSRPEGQLPMLSRLMKEVVTVPVIATGGINTIEQAEMLIKDGDADLVAIGQALLADAYWLQHSPEYIEMFPGFKYCPKCGHKV
ncbi:MAG: NADH:flavin oxidoreductase [Chloroflexi bacterium]|nr:NADH:flavin oxidoreductase [Chloroflexota bacterium]